MRKSALLAVAVVATAVGLPSLAGAAPDDVNGPACADVLDGQGGYSGSTVGVFVELAAPSCRGVTYTLVALDSASDATVVGSASTTGDGSETMQVTLAAQITDDDDSVCIYVVTTAGNGPHVFDRGPDEGCIDLEREEGGALGGMN